HTIRVETPSGTSRLELHALTGGPGHNNWYDRILIEPGRADLRIGPLRVRTLLRILAGVGWGLLGGGLLASVAWFVQRRGPLQSVPRVPCASPAWALTCVGIVLVVAGVIRAMALAELPLMIWQDSQMY